MIEEDRIAPLALPAVLLGIGLGGFLEGIVLQQILQWHHLLYWAATLIGIVMMFVAARRDDVVWSVRVLAGGVLIGAGAFGIAKGIVVWSAVMLAIGLGLVLTGFLIARSEAKAGRGTNISPQTAKALGL